MWYDVITDWILFLFMLQESGVRCVYVFFFFQAEDGIRDLVRSRGLGDVYKRQAVISSDNNIKEFAKVCGCECVLSEDFGKEITKGNLSLIHI